MMPDNTTVVFVHHANDMYGADIGLLHSIRSLDPDRYHPIVLLPSDMPSGMLSDELDRLGVEYQIAPLGVLRRKYLTLRSLIPLACQFVIGVIQVRKLILDRGAQAVYVNTIVVPSGAIGGKLARVPVVWHIREILAMPRLVRWTLQRTLKLCATQIICISSAVRESLLREAPDLKDKSVVVYNAVSLASRSGRSEEEGLRKRLGIPSDSPVIGMVGRITHWKGQEILVNAARAILLEHSTAHFVAAGSFFADEVHYLHKLEELIRNLGLEERFHLIGYRHDVADLYAAFDIFVLASRKPEPFGRVTVEAMLQGCAVIATNHGGTLEVVQDGLTGLLVPPSDPGALAAAINRLLSDCDLRSRLGSSAALYARANFDLNRYEEKMRGIFGELAVTA
jgi:glycosyltransferase involved in cell wall biosynthesis